MSCTVVTPYWIHIGWVQWHGTPQREKQFTTERRACGAPIDREMFVDGIRFRLCRAHADEVVAEKLFHWKDEEGSPSECPADPEEP